MGGLQKKLSLIFLYCNHVFVLCYSESIRNLVVIILAHLPFDNYPKHIPVL